MWTWLLPAPRPVIYGTTQVIQSNQWNWTNKVPFFVQNTQTKTKTFDERVRNHVSDLPVVYPPLEDLNSLLIHLFTNKNPLFTVQSVIIRDYRPHWTQTATPPAHFSTVWTSFPRVFHVKMRVNIRNSKGVTLHKSALRTRPPNKTRQSTITEPKVCHENFSDSCAGFCAFDQ